MDGIDLFLRSTLGTFDTQGPLGTPAERSAAPDAAAVAREPAFQEEIETIVAVVPRALQANALWAVPLLLNTARAGGITHLRRLAYVLATAQHASHFGARLVESGSGPIRDGVDQSFDRYEPGTPLGAELGNLHSGDGERFRGRGFVHIRGRAAYATWSQRLGMPDQVVNGTALPFFIAHPAALARPDAAAQSLVRGMRDGLFTGIALGHYVNDKKTDFISARRVIDRSKHARGVAEIAATFALVMERLQAKRHQAHMRELANVRATSTLARDFVQEIRDAVEQLALRGEVMPAPLQALEWDGEARQGKFIQLDEKTCALHIGRGTYVRLDIQADLNGIVPPQGRNMALKRSGDVRPAARNGEPNFWR